MRLALKLVLAFMLANIALAAIYGYLAVQREVRMFEHTASAEAESIGPAMQVVLADAWRASGYRGVQERVREAAKVQETELQIRWVWFDNRPGDPDALIATAMAAVRPGGRVMLFASTQHGTAPFDPADE